MKNSMENDIESILFARGIMPDDFISYSTYAAVAEIVKEKNNLLAKVSEQEKEIERLKEDANKDLFVIGSQLQRIEELETLISATPQSLRNVNYQQSQRIRKLEELLHEVTIRLPCNLDHNFFDKIKAALTSPQSQ